MTTGATAILVLLSLVAPVPAPSPSQSPVPTWRADVQVPANAVGLFGRLEDTRRPGGAASTGSSMSTPPGGELPERTLSECVPRIRTLDGVTHRGSVCVDGADGGLVWVPEGEQGTAADEPPAQPLVVTREDVQSLLVDSGSIKIQPDQPWVLVNAETIVFTDAAEHVLTTQLLGRDVELRVVPVRYTWDFGDGSVPLVSADPGAPWPDHTVAHAYSAVGEARVTLRTEWDAHFRVEGTGPWLPVAGRPITAATSDPFRVVTAVPRLVG